MRKETPYSQNGGIKLAVLVQAICDARIGNASTRTLLIHLARYAAEKPDFGCYPSQRRLAEESGFSLAAVKKFLRGLEQAGYIRVQGNNNMVNDYFINVPRILAEAEEMKQARGPRRVQWGESEPASTLVAQTPDRSHAAVEIESKAEAEAPEGSFTDHANAHRTGETLICGHRLTDYLRAIREKWPDHPVWEHDAYRNLLRADITESIHQCGSARRFVDMLACVKASPKKWQKVGQSGRLGSYIRSCTREWLDTFRDQMDQMDQSARDREDINENEDEEEVPA